jgi:hypothetical protein
MLKFGMRGAGFGARRCGAFDPIIERNMTHTHAAGNDGATWNSGTTTVTSNLTYVNETPSSVTEIALVFSGWKHTLNAADTLSAANYSPSWSVEYPIGQAVQNGVAPTVTPGANVVTAYLTLTTPIPAGASFKIALSVTPSASNVVPLARDSVNTFFRAAGIITHLRRSQHAKVCFGFIGDSIFTNNGLPPTAAAAGIAPSVHCSIIGSTLFQNMNQMTRRWDLFQKLGVTHVVSNYLTNDHGAGRSLATLKSDLETLAASAKAAGFKFVQTTDTPKAVDQADTTITSLTQTGGVATAVLAETNNLAVGQLLTISGATQTEYNGLIKIETLDTPSNTITFKVDPAAVSPATGSPILNHFRGYASQQVPSGNYSNGIWASMNDWIRTNPGSVSDYVELADPLCVAHNDSRWIVGRAASGGLLFDPQPLLTVQSVQLTTRFTVVDPADGTTFGAQWPTNASLIWLSGPNQGKRATPNGSSGRQIFLPAAPASAVQVGDTLAVRNDNTIMASYGDGTHPTIAFTWGGGLIMQAALAAKFAAIKAAS